MATKRHVFLSGDWQDASGWLLALLQSGLSLELLIQNDKNPRELNLNVPHLVAIGDAAHFPEGKRGWVGWLRIADNNLAIAAYQAGAKAVFPPDTPPYLILQAICEVENSQDSLAALSKVRHLEQGTKIFLETDQTLYIHEGILATIMVAEDGSEVLLDLSGRNQVLVAHPEDECYIQILAYTPAVISIYPWEHALHQIDFVEKLRSRLRRMEAWAAIQSRTYLDQRVLGILWLLAEQFGIPHPKGTLLDLRLTHSQLATAVGANRTSVTRVLKELAILGKLDIVGNGKNRRIVLCEPKGPAQH
ncbi:MAG: Crp/Fnr family transcriptional regulator [Candidatus Methanomethylicaceae archaeon]